MRKKKTPVLPATNSADNETQSKLPGKPEPFASNDSLLEAAVRMFFARHRVTAMKAEKPAPDTKTINTAVTTAGKWKEYWHICWEMTPPEIPLRAALQEHSLSRPEVEVVLALLLSDMALTSDKIHNCEDLIRFLYLSPRESFEVIRSLSPEGRLITGELVAQNEPDSSLRDFNLALDPHLVEISLKGEQANGTVAAPLTESEFYGKFSRLVQLCAQKQEAVRDLERGCGVWEQYFKARRAVERLTDSFVQIMKHNRNWRINRLFGTCVEYLFCDTDLKIVLIMIGKELGYLKSGHELFTGLGLARTVSRKPLESRSLLSSFTSDSRLLTEDWIRPTDGLGCLLSNDPDDLASTEFELSERCLSELELKRRGSRKNSDLARLVEPRFGLESLVLPLKVLEALEMAVSQAGNAKKLMIEWGLAEVIPYGRAVTLLFSGPPGTGKTASAEAMAHRLGRNLLVADYSQLQSCWVGGTEKNIVKLFGQARESAAVMFWDEADAMFFDRDSASHNWEVRDINVLLQEIEKFEGVCILATNRKVILDKALERRISLKVEFILPEYPERREIWKRLLPARMPLGEDVNLEALSEHPLSGGQIKNLILNAARLAVNGGDFVAMEHFTRALEMERAGSWAAGRRQDIGFRSLDSRKGADEKCN